MERHTIILIGAVTALCLTAPAILAAGETPVPEDELKVNYRSGEAPEDLPGFSLGQIIVKFDPNVPDTQRIRIAQEHRCWIVGSCEVGDFHLVGIPNDASPQQMVETFGRQENVEYAELDYYATASFVPDDRLFPYQWNLDNAVTSGIRMREAWDTPEGDPNVIVAIVDTGVAHEDFGVYRQTSDLAATRFVPGYDFINDDNWGR